MAVFLSSLYVLEMMAFPVLWIPFLHTHVGTLFYFLSHFSGFYFQPLALRTFSADNLIHCHSRKLPNLKSLAQDHTSNWPRYTSHILPPASRDHCKKAVVWWIETTSKSKILGLPVSLPQNIQTTNHFSKEQDGGRHESEKHAQNRTTTKVTQRQSWEPFWHWLGNQPSQAGQR